MRHRGLSKKNLYYLRKFKTTDKVKDTEIRKEALALFGSMSRLMYLIEKGEYERGFFVTVLDREFSVFQGHFDELKRLCLDKLS